MPGLCGDDILITRWGGKGSQSFTISISIQYAHPFHSSFEVATDGKHVMCGNQEARMKANAIAVCLSRQSVVQIFQRVSV